MKFYNVLGIQISAADLIGLALSIAAAIIALVSFYYLYQAAKIMAGGALERAFSRIAASVALMIYTVGFLWFSFSIFDLREDIWVAVIGPGLWLLGNVFLLLGCREIVKMTKK